MSPDLAGVERTPPQRSQASTPRPNITKALAIARLAAVIGFTLALGGCGQHAKDPVVVTKGHEKVAGQEVRGDGFSTRLPGDKEPERVVSQRSTGGKPYEMTTYSVETTEGDFCEVMTGRWPFNLERTFLDENGKPRPRVHGEPTFMDLIEGSANGAGGKVIMSRYTTLDGHPAVAGRLRVEKDGILLTGFTTAAVSQHRLFQVICAVTGEQTAAPADYTAILKSTHLE